MPQGTEAPASMLAEGQTSHTQNQAGRLTAPQLRLLHRGLDPKRVGKDDKNFSHMEAWDIKRYLLRVFGFGGYDTENRELALVREIEIPAGAKSRWTVVYRAQVRLTVKDPQGRVLGHWDGEAAGGASNQPKLDDAHDMAMKTASSQALKRAATNLGDQFGLSLYNNGSPEPVVGFCAAHPPAEWEKAAEPLPEPDDPPVQPEQGTQEQGSVTIDPACFQPHPDGQEFANQAGLATSREAVENVRSLADGQGLVNAGVLAPDSGQPDVLSAYLDRRASELASAGEGDFEGFMRRVRNGWNGVPATRMALEEARQKGFNDLVPFEGGRLPIQEVLEARLRALKERAGQSGDTERSAA
ncbi:hypothetical protein SUDANB145_07310 (plasmid) [Streptomyces sp. enrichment culture]|uniref:Rad52/Rad22 family DNA repair protein n=1 Tax=Streptomyces sp. enrichment culture TaxID=1795815 RepID=UPI003F547B1C